LVIDTVVCLTLAKWETVSGQFGGYLNIIIATCKVSIREASVSNRQFTDALEFVRCCDEPKHCSAQMFSQGLHPAAASGLVHGSESCT
jgi:hypothetical protein